MLNLFSVTDNNMGDISGNKTNNDQLIPNDLDNSSNIISNNEENNNIIVKKKRGRPKKNQIFQMYQKNNKEKKKESITLNIKDNAQILHLPIKMNEINSYLDNNNTISNNVSQNNNNIGDIKKILDIKNDSSTNNVFINETNTIFTDSDTESCKSDCKKEMQKEIRDKNIIIKQLNDELLELKNNRDSNSTFNIYSNSNVKIINIDNIYVDSTTREVNNNTSSFVCWWDCHEFDNPPCFIPDKYTDDTFHVFGCFCSYNCALAYNNNMNDFGVIERNTLIHNLYFTVTNKYAKIKSAPPKEMLEIFGGYMNIDTYRNNFIYNSPQYRHCVPPLLPIISCIEETNMSHDVYRNRRK